MPVLTLYKNKPLPTQLTNTRFACRLQPFRQTRLMDIFNTSTAPTRVHQRLLFRRLPATNPTNVLVAHFLGCNDKTKTSENFVSYMQPRHVNKNVETRTKTRRVWDYFGVFRLGTTEFLYIKAAASSSFLSSSP